MGILSSDQMWGPPCVKGNAQVGQVSVSWWGVDVAWAEAGSVPQEPQPLSQSYGGSTATRPKALFISGWGADREAGAV